MFFAKLTKCDYPVSGGTVDDKNPFAFKLFDTGTEQNVTVDLYYGYDGKVHGEPRQTVSHLLIVMLSEWHSLCD